MSFVAHRLCCSIFLTAILLSGSTQAALVVAPQAVLANGLGETAGQSLSQTIDQSGLSTGYTSGVTDWDTFVAGAPTHNSLSTSNNWLSAPGSTTGVIDFDMGTAYVIDQIALWDVTLTGAVDINSLTISVATMSDFSDALVSDTITLNDPAGVDTARPIQVFNLTNKRFGRYVRFTINSNSGSVVNTGLGEFALAATPEPGSLMLCGLSAIALGWRSRRRRRQIAE